MGKHTKGESVNNWLSRHWPLLVIAAPAAVAVWSGWVGLGGLCGFGVIHPLPGIADGVHLNTAITLPVGVEAYGAYALYAWLGGETGPRARDFAQKSAIGALILGCLGQVAFHVLAARHDTRAPGLVVVLVACLPVVTLSFAAALTHLMHADEKATGEAVTGRATELAITADEALSGEAVESHPEEPSESQESSIETGPEDATAEAIADAMPEALEVPAAEPEPEPREVPSGKPRPGPVRLSKDPEAKKARAAYWRSVRAGSPLTDRALGEMFGRSRTWGASRIAECQDGPQLAAGASS